MMGWNTPFFCWPRLRPGERCMIDFVNMLDEDAYQDLGVADTEGWTVLHRVAAFGQAEEIEALLRLGADVWQIALPLRWTAIHHAVFYGNAAAFVTLTPHYGSKLITMSDERGWTLLHIAASAGHDCMVRQLLELGANHTSQSKPFYSHMPDSLFGRCCTPREVAAAQSSGREQQYLNILLGQGIRVDPAFWEADPDSEGEAAFWEAQESLV